MPNNLSQYLYIEPFLGGALLFHLQPDRALVNDCNEELINVYKVVKNQPEALIKNLKQHLNDSEYFYKIRELDRTGQLKKLSNVERASRVIYLNKTCYNGLYRVNKAGEFNSPYGYYKNPNIVNETVLRSVSNFLNSSRIEIISGDFYQILLNAPQKSFVYLDPPYHPISHTSNFTGYIKGGWKKEDQIRLKDCCDLLTEKGIIFLLSNSNCKFIRHLYSNYYQHEVQANRNINSIGEERGAIKELLITNYDKNKK